MKNILTILKKEFSRFFRDKRMVLSIFLPGILIFLVYSVIGSVISSNLNGGGEQENYTAYIENAPYEMNRVFSLLDKKSYENSEEAKKDVAEGNLDLVIIFPVDFSEKAGTATPPDIRIFYNNSQDSSVSAYSFISAMLEGYKQPTFTINADGQGDLAEDKAMVGKILSMVMSMLMFSLLASGCMAVAPEAIAGEKERGTLATMLITPIKRWQLACGKIISLACFATLSGLSSFIGVILSLPKLMDGMLTGEAAAYYSAGDYFMLFGLIISVVLVIISAFSIFSALAKSVKEAGSLIAPLMVVIILFGALPMFFTTVATGLYAIPLFGSSLAFSSIMAFTITPLGYALSVISNLATAAVLIVVLSFMFNSERIMFNR